MIPAAYNSTINKVRQRMSRYLRLGTSAPNAERIAPGDGGAERGLLLISRGTAILLLVVYLAYLWFQLKSHAFLYHQHGDEEEGSITSQQTPAPEEPEEEEEAPNMNLPSAAIAYVSKYTSGLAPRY